jgi:hypothetical protein
MENIMRFGVSADYRFVVDARQGYAIAEGPAFIVDGYKYQDACAAAQAFAYRHEAGVDLSWRKHPAGYKADYLGRTYLLQWVCKEEDQYWIYCDGSPLCGEDGMPITAKGFGEASRHCQRMLDKEDGPFRCTIDDGGPVTTHWRNRDEASEEPEEFWVMRIDPATGELIEWRANWPFPAKDEPAILAAAKTIGWRHQVGEAVLAFADSAPSDQVVIARRLLELMRAAPIGQDFAKTARLVGAIRIEQGSSGKLPVYFCGLRDHLDEIDGGWLNPSDAARARADHALEKFIELCEEIKNG